MAVRYLLDSDIFIYIRQRKPVRVAEVLARKEPDSAAISTISYGELLFGATKSKNPAVSLSMIHGLLQVLPVLPLPPATAELYASIRNELAAAGQLIGPNDLWIAAHALAENLVLVTNNEREFKRVKGLKVENWVR